jgi:hypothetical protein
MNYFNYFSEIEDTFVRRRGKHLFLSPLDWAMIDTWQERGIPLNVVLRAIEAVFDVYDRQPPSTRSIKSLFYCREEVEVQYAEWVTSQVGNASSAGDQEHALSPEAISAYLVQTIEKLKAVRQAELQEGISRAIERLEELRSEVRSDAESIDETLSHIEQLLDRELLENLDASTIKSAEKEVQLQLKPFKADMPAESYQTTFQLMLLKKLREDAGIPRLGLFYL